MSNKHYNSILKPGSLGGKTVEGNGRKTTHRQSTDNDDSVFEHTTGPADLPTTRLREVTRYLSEENVALRKYLNLVLENCDLNTANVLVTVMSMCDDRLRSFLTGHLRFENENETSRDTGYDKSSLKTPSPKRITFDDTRLQSYPNTVQTISNETRDYIRKVDERLLSTAHKGGNPNGSFGVSNSSNNVPPGVSNLNSSYRSFKDSKQGQSQGHSQDQTSCHPESPSYGNAFQSVGMNDLEQSKIGQRSFEGQTSFHQRSPSYGNSFRSIGINDLEDSKLGHRSLEHQQQSQYHSEPHLSWKKIAEQVAKTSGALKGLASYTPRTSRDSNVSPHSPSYGQPFRSVTLSDFDQRQTSDSLNNTSTSNARRKFQQVANNVSRQTGAIRQMTPVRQQNTADVQHSIKNGISSGSFDIKELGSGNTSRGSMEPPKSWRHIAQQVSTKSSFLRPCSPGVQHINQEEPCSPSYGKSFPETDVEQLLCSDASRSEPIGTTPMSRNAECVTTTKDNSSNLQYEPNNRETYESFQDSLQSQNHASINDDVHEVTPKYQNEDQGTAYTQAMEKYYNAPIQNNSHMSDSLNTTYNTVKTHQSTTSNQTYVTDSINSQRDFTADSLDRDRTQQGDVTGNDSKWKAVSMRVRSWYKEQYTNDETRNSPQTEQLIGRPQGSSTPISSPRDRRTKPSQGNIVTNLGGQTTIAQTSVYDHHNTSSKSSSHVPSGIHGEVSGQELAYIMGLEGNESTNKARNVYYRAIDLLTNYRPSLNSTLTESLQKTRPSRRIVGEIAFQLDRRILEHVFAYTGIGKHSAKRRARYYGFSVANVRYLIAKEAKRLKDKYPEVDQHLEERLVELLQKLSKLSYDLDHHGDFTQDMVNKYGLLTAIPAPDTIEGAWLNDAGSLRILIGRSLKKEEELADMLIVLDCLCFMAFEDKKPLVVW